MGIQLRVLGIETCHVVGAGKDDPLDPVDARSLINVKGAANIGLENFFKGALN